MQHLTRLAREHKLFAALLLAEPSMPLSEVADRCGFGSLSTFRRSFAKGMKRTPMEYRIKELNLPPP